MILRKPYAFFIKYFRLFNLIMAILMGILIYRTGIIARFFSDYINDYVTASNGFMVGSYINLYSFLLALLIIILTIVVLSVLFVKEKPKKLYITNLILYIGVIVLYGFDYYIMHGVNEAILDIRVSKAAGDITNIVLIFQVIAFVLTLIRATGFDIKSFNFATDLQKLDIDTKDNEEFEVAVEFDKNKMNRNMRKTARNIIHTYQERKYLINLIIIIVIIIIAFILFINKTIYSANYKEGQPFQASRVVMNIKNAYITQNDSNGNLIMIKDGKLSEKLALVVIKFDVRRLSTDENQKLNTGLITLRIGDKSYSQTPQYNDNLTDIGTPYVDQKLSEEFTNYILAFVIPFDKINEKMTLKFNDNISYVKGELGAKNIFVNLKPQDLTGEKELKEEKINEIVSFSGSILGNSELVINEFTIDDKFKIAYDFCASKNNCYKSYEYVTPTATGNYFKTLMRINGDFEPDTANNVEDVNDIYYFLNEFGTIHYKIGDEWYSHKINSQLIRPKTGKDNYYYIEINKDIKKASEIYLTFSIRDYHYKYVLK
ncbi:MAG: hypothetical protein HFH47_02005 [Bacilli bacterium]|nr:hypothetical protein [Bacilli bacterium]